MAAPQQLMTPAEAKVATFRFAVGDRVMCNMGGGQWEHGTVVNMGVENVAQGIPEGRCAAYGVKLDSSSGDGLCYVPFDNDNCCKQSAVRYDSVPLRRSPVCEHRRRRTGVARAPHHAQLQTLTPPPPPPHPRLPHSDRERRCST